MFLNNKYKEILGVNRRNQEYIRPYNSNKAKDIADNKILTKRILSRNGIQTPEVYKLIRNRKQLEFLNWESLPKSFVIKPNKGTGGSGIVIFYGKKKGELAWIRPNGSVMSKNDIAIHIANILEGRYSMGNKNDIAIIEERVKTDPFLKQYSYKGVPDLRIICFNGVPVMAMTRIPTKRSNGTANLHSGAICTGIDIATGITTYSMQMNLKSPLDDIYEDIEATTDLKENKKLSGIAIPNWNEILEIALKCQKVSKIGFIGVDITIDADKGPVVFELNARPGLGIQVANKAGLRSRLELVKGIKVKSIKHGIKIAKDLFGGEIEESIESISGRKVVNIVEKVTIFKQTNKKEKEDKLQPLRAFMDTGYMTSRITETTAHRMGFISTTKYFNSLDIPKKFNSHKEAQEYIDQNNKILTMEEKIKRIARVVDDGDIKIRPVIDVTIKIAGEIKDLEVVIMQDLEYPVIIGRTDLKGYLIDTTNTF